MIEQTTDHIVAVRDRLAAKFPSVHDSVVQTAVDAALARLASAKVTDFLPLLVERSATADLKSQI